MELRTLNEGALGGWVAEIVDGGGPTSGRGEAGRGRPGSRGDEEAGVDAAVKSPFAAGWERAFSVATPDLNACQHDTEVEEEGFFKSAE